MIITRHAYRRGYQRFGVKNSKLRNLAEDAYDNGLALEDYIGINDQIDKYINNTIDRHNRKWVNVKLKVLKHKFIFIFSGELLVTVFQFPYKYISEVIRHGEQNNS